ncbi:MAG: hypothetical protein JOZ93_16855, partial [Sinobacteraceae bacterium]|nr:hypothetical protein [Nevskiaceae bacterium]
IIDMGPEAGEGGGRIVAQGAPSQIARQRKESHTGRVLGDFLRTRTALEEQRGGEDDETEPRKRRASGARRLRA